MKKAKEAPVEKALPQIISVHEGESSKGTVLSSDIDEDADPAKQEQGEEQMPDKNIERIHIEDQDKEEDSLPKEVPKEQAEKPKISHQQKLLSLGNHWGSFRGKIDAQAGFKGLNVQSCRSGRSKRQKKRRLGMAKKSPHLDGDQETESASRKGMQDDDSQPKNRKKLSQLSLFNSLSPVKK